MQAKRVNLGSWTSTFLRGLLLAVFLGYPMVLGLDYFYVFEPYLYPLHMLQGHVRPVDRQVLIGPYPEYVELEQLHRSGVRAVISLLDPRLIYEKGLIQKEQRYEHALGMRTYNFPLNSSRPATDPRNARHLAQILAALSRLKGEKVYIHCYLGRHRVEYVAKDIERLRALSKTASARPTVRAE